MKIAIYLFPFLYILGFGIFCLSALALPCENGFTKKSVPAEMAFAQNFKRGNITEENRFFVIESSSSLMVRVGQIIEKIGNNQILTEIIDFSSWKLKRTTVDMIFHEHFPNSKHTEEPITKRSAATDMMFHEYFLGSKYTEGYVTKIGDDKGLSTETKKILQGSPQLENIFKAFQSTRKRVDSRELILPKKDKAEETLEARGYSSFWFRGLNEVNEWLAIKEQFIKLRVNPRITHIDYFADKIPDHIEHIRRGITFQSQFQSGRLKALEHLKKKAEKAINEKSVTYKWWIEFNYALSIVLSPIYYKILDPEAFSHEKMNTLINLFPENILIPTTKGELGIITVNKVYSQGIYPVGLVKVDRKIHNSTLSPQGFFLHDIGHVRRHNNVLHSSEAHRRFHNFLMKRIQHLPAERRKSIELIYFILTHELNNNFIHNPLYILQTNLDSIADTYYKDFRNFINIPDHYRKQIIRQVEEDMNNFMEIFFQIKKEQNDRVTPNSTSPH